MKLQNACFVFGTILALTVPAWAQSKAIPPAGISTGTQTTSTGTGTQTTTGTGTQSTSTGTGAQSTGAGTRTTTTSTGAFQNLSPGGQRIAQSLFSAQHPPTGTQALTLDQIATMKGREGWGRVFKEMKADGLVQARNLGQVVSGHAHTASTNTATGTINSGRQFSTQRQSSTGTGRRGSAVVTNGAGRSMSFVSAGGRGGGHYAGGYSTHMTSGTGMAYGGGMQGGPGGGGFQGSQGGGGFHGGGGGGGHGR
jgi:hypothetical protein